MTAAVFIGDEVTAAAYRLAGIVARTPPMRDLPRVFDKALDEADLVVITAEYAQAMNDETLRSAVRRADPLVLVMPDGGNRFMPENLDARVDRVLGIEP